MAEMISDQDQYSVITIYNFEQLREDFTVLFLSLT